jgi:integrase
MAIVAMCTGLRVSEILALRWEHFDFEKGFLDQHAIWRNIARYRKELPLSLLFLLGRLVGIEPTTS